MRLARLPHLSKTVYRIPRAPKIQHFELNHIFLWFSYIEFKQFLQNGPHHFSPLGRLSGTGHNSLFNVVTWINCPLFTHSFHSFSKHSYRALSCQALCEVQTPINTRESYTSEQTVPVQRDNVSAVERCSRLLEPREEGPRTAFWKGDF